MTEFEIAKIAVEMFKMNLRKIEKEYFIEHFNYKKCVEMVKEAHGVESSEENCECPSACKLHWSVAIRKYKEGYDKGYLDGFNASHVIEVKSRKSTVDKNDTAEETKTDAENLYLKWLGKEYEKDIVKDQRPRKEKF